MSEQKEPNQSAEPTSAETLLTIKKTGFLALTLCAIAAAIVTGGFVVYAKHIQHGAPVTAIEAISGLFFLPGLFLSAVFMLSLPATHVLMYGGAFIELFVLFFSVFWVVRRLLRRADA